MNAPIQNLIAYRMQEAKEAREEAEILLRNGKLRGGDKQSLLCNVLCYPCPACNQAIQCLKTFRSNLPVS